MKAHYHSFVLVSAEEVCAVGDKGGAMVTRREQGAPDESKRWFREAAFGMFIHWGVYSVPGRGEWIMYNEHIPPEEYAELARQFKPKRWNPEAWVRLAKEAGMKYMFLCQDLPMTIMLDQRHWLDLIW